MDDRDKFYFDNFEENECAKVFEPVFLFDSWLKVRSNYKEPSEYLSTAQPL